MKHIVYADNNATTRIAPEVFEAMKPFLTERYGNPSSMYSFGGSVHKDIEEARMKVASLLGAGDPAEIMFTSCGTESDNAAIIGTLRTYPDKKHIITTRVEHAAVLNLCQYMETTGYRVTYLDVNEEGMIDLNELKSSIDTDTAIISVMYANNETGVIFPVEEIAEIARKRNVVFHTDAVQAAGKVPLAMTELPADMVSISGHKLHAPKGVGALYIRRGTKFKPFMIGGHQEHSRRGGTENVASIVGLGRACELAVEHFDDETKRVKGLRDRLETTLLKKIPNTRLNGSKEKRLPNTTNIGFEFIEGEAILLMLDAEHIAASSGSACTSGSLSPSHVLRAMGIPFTFIQGSIRFSLSRYNTDEDIDHIIKYMEPIIEKLRKISPYGS
ncbi:MAG: cysteine desulfurase NifS [Candidatus Omnitrophica bacterium]|nr:cysteine desulfurase NifS [Candidatus Omnitrophota bacterium]